ncbi:MAG: aspartate carbamoyltransferase [archaeon]|nr:aspartate carbamoyltransferase [archaeon]
MNIKHVISVEQFLDKNILADLFDTASFLEHKDSHNSLKRILSGKLLASLFYEPSTRTRFSFEAAMQKLGGNTISTENATQFSSVTKGESIQDTIRIISQYADVIVLRHFEEGSALKAAEVSSVPIINAGDGIGEHPTQAFLDLFTIQKELGSLNNIKIALVGDLLYGRTIHSLIKLLSIYPQTQIHFVSPEQLRIPQKYKQFLENKNISFEETNNLDSVLEKINVLYVTRIQKERFADIELYNSIKNSFEISLPTLDKLADNAVIMHPLPRVKEISPEIDLDRRAAYFRQARNGLYIRMALLQKLLYEPTRFAQQETLETQKPELEME